jgi:uncharacterized protein
MSLHQEIVVRVAAEVKSRFTGEGSGHDWFHIERVWKNAKHIGATEQADMFVVELAALLHDIADWKFHSGDEAVGPARAREILVAHNVVADTIDHVAQIIATMSYKGAGVPTPMATIEGKIVQDADRLDALGAIGIARTFAYGGHKGRLLYDPDRKPEMHTSKEAYFKTDAPTINHFYEKLLLLKDRMNTAEAKRMAEGRHRFMEQFLEQFYSEWEGNI